MSDAPVLFDLPAAPPEIAADPVLRRIKAGLRAIYGARLAGAVLYGSRARGDNSPDSDYDILVLLKGEIDWLKERWRLAELAAEIGLETDETPSFLLVPDGALGRQSIFMHNVRADGVAL